MLRTACYVTQAKKTGSYIDTGNFDALRPFNENILISLGKEFATLRGRDDGQLVSSPGGGGIPLCGLYRYVRPKGYGLAALVINWVSILAIFLHFGHK